MKIAQNRTLRKLAAATTLQNAVSARPTLPTDLVAVTANQQGGRAIWGLLQITLAAGAVTLAGPVRLMAEVDGAVVSMGELNAGASIVVAANSGYQEMVLGAFLAEKLVVDPASVAGGGTFTVKIIPVGESAG